jgi:hypothetical protein
MPVMDSTRHAFPRFGKLEEPIVGSRCYIRVGPPITAMRAEMEIGKGRYRIRQVAEKDVWEMMG